MARCASKIILDEWKLDPAALTLVSGGSAWCDHVAVDLFLNDARFQQSKLLLYLPCKFSKKFIDEKSWHGCGRLLNELHQNFSGKLGRSSLADIQQASQRSGATIDTTSRGFFARNIRVGRVDRMIAFSAGAGGTAHTWKNSSTPQACKRHISLQSLCPATPKNLFTIKPKSANTSSFTVDTKIASHPKTFEKPSFGNEKAVFEKQTELGIGDTIPVPSLVSQIIPTPGDSKG